MEQIQYKKIDTDSYEKLTNLIKNISDEGDFFPFTSEDYNVSKQEQMSFIKKLNENKNCFLICAFDKDQMIGLGYLYGGNRVRNYHSTTLGIGVMKNYSGFGIGTKLMENIIQYAYESDVIGKINVQVLKTNTNAIKFYKKFGFKIEGVETRSLFIDGEFVDALNMGYILE